MKGEPVVNGPWADVALIPSLMIDVTCFFSASTMLTVKCTVVLPPAATERLDHVTVPPTFVPPPSAETNVVFAGTGSVIVTPVAAALPMFLSVSVYVTSLEGPTGLPASTFESTSAGTGALGSEILNAPRPWVPAAMSRCDGSSSSCQIVTIGKPLPSDSQ